MGIAKGLNFPLSNFAASYGAGLATKGDESSVVRKVAEVVVIEMGYNDEAAVTSDQAVSQIRKQLWFTTLAQSQSIVKLVVFVNQPSYRQVAGARKRKGHQWAHGDVIHGSQFVPAAAQLVESELGICTTVLDKPGEELYAGLKLCENNELWQDVSTCRSYRSHGIDYDASNQPALWYDAQHPSAAGAEAHFRRLVVALQGLVHTLDEEASTTADRCPSLVASNAAGH